MISVLILTKNEEQDLPGCLDSVSWCDDIHIFDSGSTDRTVEIAHARGAAITTRPFDTYARQRNAALELPFRHPWLLVLDADERCTPALSAEIHQVISTVPNSVSAFRIRRRDFLWGTWLKHAQLTPFYIRLLRVGHIHYTRDINEVVEVDGEIRALHSPFDHLAFSKGISHWVAKHNLYSTQEAELLASGDAVHAAPIRDAFFARDFHDRRVAQKALFYRFPTRPLLKWISMMFLRGAVLDGSAGVMYATLQSFYEYLIEVKCREILRRRQGKPI
ncbi:MAG TPA: glycosyltransferase family 2 protein [Acidobacteriaceae bacterium]|jgi:glycosyltransferase involved in cell wall biosynthesis|nr:glycosyltransferase family 2 protein [Acidobacteriaceae bacterium]